MNRFFLMIPCLSLLMLTGCGADYYRSELPPPQPHVIGGPGPGKSQGQYASDAQRCSQSASQQAQNTKIDTGGPGGGQLAFETVISGGVFYQARKAQEAQATWMGQNRLADDLYRDCMTKAGEYVQSPYPNGMSMSPPVSSIGQPIGPR